MKVNCFYFSVCKSFNLKCDNCCNNVDSDVSEGDFFVKRKGFKDKVMNKGVYVTL